MFDRVESVHVWVRERIRGEGGGGGGTSGAEVKVSMRVKCKLSGNQMPKKVLCHVKWISNATTLEWHLAGV